MNSGLTLECCERAKTPQRVSLKNGVYQVQVCLGAQGGAVEIALHGIMTLEGACEASRIFDGYNKVSTAWACAE